MIMKRFLLFTVLFFVFCMNSYALPKCKGDFWDNCTGVFTSPEGDKYEGEFKNNKPYRKGSFTWSDGKKYVGEHKDGKPDGKGTSITPEGDKYKGGWKDGKPVPFPEDKYGL